MYSMRFETEELRGGANGGYAEKLQNYNCDVEGRGGEGRGGDQGVE